MKDLLKELTAAVENLALDTVMLDSEDVSGLGKTLTLIESIEVLCQESENEVLVSAVEAMRSHIESAIMGDQSDLGPFETGVSHLQAVCRKLVNDESIDEELASLLNDLGCNGTEEAQPDAGAGDPNAGKTGAIADSEGEMPLKGNTPETSPLLSEEDKEIIADFGAESLENLATIEVLLMDLEQDPSDLETINSIFRPFHTVKGVSGFLNFDKINKLAHMAENLLDKTRNQELTIDGEIVDIILESVDLLKQMIENVQSTLDPGPPHEGDVDTEPLITKINHFVDQAGKNGAPVLGEVLVTQGAVSQMDVEQALELQKEGAEKKLGEILVQQKKAKTKEVVSALREQKKFGGATALQVKVDTQKLDSIVDMVGELAIAQSMLRQNELVLTKGNRQLYQITNQLNLIISDLQSTAMSLRMVPIKNTFQKMLRLVRDLAKKAGKEVRLVMTGEDTEIDRNMVEEIYEPMVHMIRNSIDHGIEKPPEREANDKPRQGTIHLKAYHRGGDIVIEIEDDGQGLNRERIRKKAMETGLINEDEQYSDSEIDNLIFHPGFSTAEEITDISGRGVGTDVVKSKIDKLKGSVEVQSNTGRGTTFFIRLPLTLAIVDGMVIRVADERYIIPTLNVRESFRPIQDDYYTVKGTGEMIKVRDNLIPLVRLDDLFGLNGGGSNGAGKAPWERLVVVVENQEKSMCLLVDELVSQEEIVIKNLGGWLKGIEGIAGSTIMGDGKVGLILDVAGIYNMTSMEP